MLKIMSSAQLVMVSDEVAGVLKKSYCFQVQAHDIICTTCWTEARARMSSPNVSHIGNECVLCHVTLPQRARSHQIISLRTDTAHLVNVRSIILERLLPLQVTKTFFHFISVSTHAVIHCCNFRQS